MFNPDYFINTNHYEIKKEEEDKATNTIKNKLKIKIRNRNIIGNNYIFKSVRKLHLRIIPDDNETFEKLFLEKNINQNIKLIFINQ